MLASLNAFDWFLVVVLAISTIRGFSRGIIRVLFSIGGLIAGILLASWTYGDAAQWLRRWIHSRETAQVLGFLLILVGVVILFGLVAAIVRRTANAVGLGPVDRMVGAAFGVLRGCLLGVLIMTGLAAFVPNSSWVKNSQLSPYFLTGAHALSFVVPQHFQKQIAEGATHFLHRAPNSLKPHSLDWKHSD